REGARAGLQRVPGHVRARQTAVGGVRRHRGRAAAAGWCRDGCGRYGSAMRWRPVACVVLGVTAVVCSVIAATAPPSPPPAPPPAVSSSEASFHSVRSYADVAEPVRLRVPALGIDAPLTHLGVAPDQTIEVPADFAVPGWF